MNSRTLQSCKGNEGRGSYNAHNLKSFFKLGVALRCAFDYVPSSERGTASTQTKEKNMITTEKSNKIAALRKAYKVARKSRKIAEAAYDIVFEESTEPDEACEQARLRCVEARRVENLAENNLANA